MDAIPMAWRKNNRTAGTAASATLPDDVILEILSRAVNDVAALFRCTVACKLWRALVADPSFLRRRWPEGTRHPSSLLGLFGHRKQTSDRAWISGPPAFFPMPRSPLRPGGRFPSSFGPCTVGLLDKAVPLASRQGLLLVRLFPQGSGHTAVHLAVCNMFDGTCDLLPPLKSVFSISTSAILTDADYCSDKQQASPSSRYSNTFKVLVIIHEYVPREWHLNLCSFSSAESSWSRLKKSFDIIESNDISRNCSNIVVCRDKVHWLVWDVLRIRNLYTFQLSSETIHVCSTMLSRMLSIPREQLEFTYDNQPLLNATVDGKLQLLSLHTECLKLDIWTHQDKKEISGDGDVDWLCTKVIELKHRMLHIGEVSRTYMGERSGTFLIMDQHNLMYLVNLETGAVDEVPSKIFSQKIYNIVPFEIDWPAFFMSHLEVKTEAIQRE